MSGTIITTGDLNDLCADAGDDDTSFSQKQVAMAAPKEISFDSVFTPSSVSTVQQTNKSLVNFCNPSPLTSVNSTLTPSCNNNFPVESEHVFKQPHIINFESTAVKESFQNKTNSSV